MRTKEDAHDYRYFPDPDLLPVDTGVFMDEVRARRPELPAEKRERFVRDFGVTPYDASVLASEQALADYFETAAKGGEEAEERGELDPQRPAQRAQRRGPDDRRVPHPAAGAR